ncbi:hypothetical protein AVEN_231996-1 [Araneus ventricosus]|uniref:Uncharacterized protein n=1 Tax=Araneus ventricosus TaxID=182803 RepID=A0A4Y2C032_ARAVE|nr:hypothetical protein AVEN_231996-1 [Araneus ventricosus]
MGPCDDLPAKPELFHWGRMIRARRELVTQLCRGSVNSAIKKQGVMCRLTATAFAENEASVRGLRVLPLFGQCLYHCIVPNKSRPPHASGAALSPLVHSRPYTLLG